MGILEIVGMWAFAVVAFIIVTNWPMGKESDRRTSYWERFEGR